MLEVFHMSMNCVIDGGDAIVADIEQDHFFVLSIILRRPISFHLV